MQPSRFACIAVVLALGGTARADRVHLVGGSVIEGKATRQGDKVVVEVESGELTLAADGVARIETSESPVQYFESHYAKLAKSDVKGLLALADYCRDHDMRDRERQVLQKIIEADPDQREARARLGFVRTDAGWMTHDDQMRAQGMVQHEGQWVTREQLAQIERAEAEAAIAARERDRAQTELELELERRRAQRETEQSEHDAVLAQTMQPAAVTPQVPYAYGWSYPLYTTYAPYPTYRSGWWAGTGSACYGGRCTPAAPVSGPARAPFPIPGVRDPFDYDRRPAAPPPAPAARDHGEHERRPARAPSGPGARLVY